MEEKRSMNKSLVVVSLLLLSVVAVLIVLFVLRPADHRDTIVLPTVQPDLPHDSVIDVPAEHGFMQINPENVLLVLDTLNPPGYYFQSYRIQVSSGRTVSEKNVKLWVNRELIHAEVYDERGTKSVFSDGRVAWIWYSNDLNPVSITLEDGFLLEDLIGLPNFDYRSKMIAADRLDGGYGYQEDAFQQYLYIHTRDAENVVSEYRFSLESGLLCSCRTTEDDALVYDVVETEFERLVYGDQAFDGRFCLPDGTVPFTVETRMLQP